MAGGRRASEVSTATARARPAHRKTAAGGATGGEGGETERAAVEWGGERGGGGSVTGREVRVVRSETDSEESTEGEENAGGLGEWR